MPNTKLNKTKLNDIEIKKIAKSPSLKKKE